jgi:hypothetical protein
MLVSLGSCVTVNVNIYFPAAAAEKAADKIIDEVWKLENPGSGETKPGGDQSSTGSNQSK